MSLKLGKVSPTFNAATTRGVIDSHQWLGDSWGVLFSHPVYFTPVCPAEFERCNVKAIAVSVDPLDSHHGWVKDINETQACTVNFPIIADEDRQVASAYDMIHPNADDKAKDRAAYSIIAEAEAAGKPKPGGTIIEGTAGNTGIGLTMVGLPRRDNTVLEGT